MLYCHCINGSVYGAKKRGSSNNVRKGSMTEALRTLRTSFPDPSRPCTEKDGGASRSLTTGLFLATWKEKSAESAV